MSSQLHVKCLEYKCHCAHHLPSVSCTVVTWALLPWTHRFTSLVQYQDKANRHWCDLFSLNNLLWNPTGGDITLEWAHGFCLHCRACVLRHAPTFSVVLFVFQLFPSATVVMTFLNHYLSLSNHLHFYRWSKLQYCSFLLLFFISLLHVHW